tara:strand:- start:1096 stop:2277 length:1182 start_codon:yes stop_codon:yes gene_type:complete
MIKIGIFSLPLNWNYGGILQQYALSEYIKKKNFKPIIFSRRASRKSFLILLIVNLKWKIIMILEKLNCFNFLPLVATESFKKKFLDNKTKDFFDSKKITIFIKKNKIKHFIVGSDQIWNINATPSLYDSFLGFVDKDKNNVLASYAPSFAHDDWRYSTKQTQNTKILLKNFSYISVRETHGVELIKKYLDNKSIRVLDPTFLLDASDYYKLLTNIKSNKKKIKTIFCYILKNDIKIIKSINKYAKQNNLKKISFCGLGNFFNLIKNVTGNYSVESWISSLKDSKLVITDSFHGMVFSIIFKKNFYVLLNQNNGTSRIYSLLKDLGLESRIIKSIDDKLITQNDINWNPVEIRLAKLKLESKVFLEKFFNKVLNKEGDYNKKPFYNAVKVNRVT